MAKKARLLALALLAAVLLAGCSGGEDEPVQETQAVEPADTDNVEGQAAPPAENAPANPSEQGEPGGRGFGFGQPDLAAAAEQLGVSEEELTAALGDLGQGMPDFEAAAAQLGVTVEELYAALGFQGRGTPGGRGPGGPGFDIGQLDLAAAAEQLGVSEEELSTALGDLGQGMPDFEAAAAQLGVTVEELYAALGFPEGFTPGGGGPGEPPGEPPANE
jgi:cytochrome c556